jgi:hypothetical protein
MDNLSENEGLSKAELRFKIMKSLNKPETDLNSNKGLNFVEVGGIPSS